LCLGELFLKSKRTIIMKTNKEIKLDQLDKKLPFKVPENYFENFAANFDAQLQKKKVKSVSLTHRLRPYLYAAAIFVGVLVVSVPIYKKLHKPAEIQVNEEFKSYVASEVDEDLVVDYMANKDLE
jgi:hypothetical protein